MTDQEEMGPCEKIARVLMPVVANTTVPHEVIDAFLQVFDNGPGREVLESQLRSLHLFNRVQNEADGHTYNSAVGLLESLGVIKRDHNGKILNMREIVTALLTVARMPQKEDENANA